MPATESSLDVLEKKAASLAAASERSESHSTTTGERSPQSELLLQGRKLRLSVPLKQTQAKRRAKLKGKAGAQMGTSRPGVAGFWKASRLLRLDWPFPF